MTTETIASRSIEVIARASPSKLLPGRGGKTVTGAMAFEATKRFLSDKPTRRPNRTKPLGR